MLLSYTDDVGYYIHLDEEIRSDKEYVKVELSSGLGENKPPSTFMRADLTLILNVHQITENKVKRSHLFLLISKTVSN